eukprot:scaffold1319_cov126-Cylindrotheca_fusiformis.AAC.20
MSLANGHGGAHANYEWMSINRFLKYHRVRYRKGSNSDLFGPAVENRQLELSRDFATAGNLKKPFRLNCSLSRAGIFKHKYVSLHTRTRAGSDQHL